jgi:hypothetical protein
VSAFRLLPIAWILFDIRFHAGIEDALAVVLAVKARVEIVIAELALRSALGQRQMRQNKCLKLVFALLTSPYVFFKQQAVAEYADHHERRKFYRVWPYPRSTERLSGNLQRYDYGNRGLLEQRTSYNEPL